MFTSAEITFYDENDNSNCISLSNTQIYAIRKILGLNYDYNNQSFLCYDDESVKQLTKDLFGKILIKK